jgi:hypothetical protein
MDKKKHMAGCEKRDMRMNTRENVREGMIGLDRKANEQEMQDGTEVQGSLMILALFETQLLVIFKINITIKREYTYFHNCFVLSDPEDEQNNI